jgi:hypothetical protein
MNKYTVAVNQQEYKMQTADKKMQTEKKRVWVIIEGRWSRVRVESRNVVTIINFSILILVKILKVLNFLFLQT